LLSCQIISTVRRLIGYRKEKEKWLKQIWITNKNDSFTLLSCQIISTVRRLDSTYDAGAASYSTTETEDEAGEDIEATESELGDDGDEQVIGYNVECPNFCYGRCCEVQTFLLLYDL